MRKHHLYRTLKPAIRVLGLLPFAALAAFGATQAVNLTAGPASLALPDGSAVPMWGYSCGAPVGGSLASCAKLNPAAAGWSPVVISVPTGETLQINLTNSLTFTTAGTPTTVPTSIMILGQLGGGLGSGGTVVASPDHSNAQLLSWPIPDSTAKGTPPTQGPRVQSFGTEVPTGSTVPLTWTTPRAGTYLMESGTHPSIQGPMGLYGMVVVTGAGTAYPSVNYDADVKMLMSEIDPVQNTAVDKAVRTAGFDELMVWSGQPGGCGNPSSGNYNQCYPPAVNYTPLYYLFNGVAFDKSNASNSLFPVSTSAPANGKVLVRLVNAGLRMHVPSIVGSLTGATPVGGFTLIAEDGNPLPGVARIQSEVFMPAGKTFDVMLNTPAAGGTALPIFDRQLSLSGNAVGRDSGMLAYIGVNGAGVPSAPAFAAAVARPDSYQVAPARTLTVSDASKGLLANDTNVTAVQLNGAPTQGTLTLNSDGTFTYKPNTGWAGGDSFGYCGNGSCTTVTLAPATIRSGGVNANPDSYSSTAATFLIIKAPGVLANDSDVDGYPLVVDTTSIVPQPGLTVNVDQSGAFNASVAAAGDFTFQYKAKNSQGTLSALTTATLHFPTPTGLNVTLIDGKTKNPVLVNGQKDYRWIIEEDRTFFTDPNATTNTGSNPGGTSVQTLGTNFHTSYMPLVAQGCVGTISCEAGQTILGQPGFCDPASGICKPGAQTQRTPLDPSQVALDPHKRYYISVLPGDGADALSGDAALGHAHGMGGAPISPGQTNVMVIVEPSPFNTATVTAFVFEDDFPLNGEQDAGGGVDVLAPNEPGLGGFQISIFDDAGGPGDATGQVGYDMFNMPLANSLAGTIDPATGRDACPISTQAHSDPLQQGISGHIVTCPKFEQGGTILSPLAGQAVVRNLFPGRYGIVATPGADRIGRGEEWLQTNTLDGQKAHDSFIRVNEPGYFQEFGPAGYHVAIGFANPAIINARKPVICSGGDPTGTIDIVGFDCTYTVNGMVSTERMSRTPDERLYGSGSRDSFSYTQCYVSLGDTDGADFAFTKCDADGKFTLTGIPQGSWRITIFDQWNDQLVDGLSTPVSTDNATNHIVDMGEIAINQWQSNIYTRTFFDKNGNGISDDGEPGLAFVDTNIRFRDGSFSNFNNTDLDGYAGFNEVFPLFNWYVVETDTTRYKSTGTHVVYDAGGPADGSNACGNGTDYPKCEPNSNIANFMANTLEIAPLPSDLRFPGSVYCDNADCSGFSIANGKYYNPATGSNGADPTGTMSTGRIDPPWVETYGWQGFSGQNNFLEFGKMPFDEHENGGIYGHVVYASTRPFDDPALLLQLSWEPQVPGVTMNLYKKDTAPDGSDSLKLVDTTKTSSWDDWAQGFRAPGIPNMNCAGQVTSDLFYFTLYNQPMFLDQYNNQFNGGPTPQTIAHNSQFKCYDGMHNWNQLQPAPYDGKYAFPSVTARNATNGRAAGTNCSICSTKADGEYMLPTGKYVVEVVVPPGYELVKEEDKNILIGDTYIAPVTVQFPNLASGVYIMPDQAEVASMYNANSPWNSTHNLGRAINLPSHEGDTGSIETFWPCVGQARVVPDFISMFPGSGEIAPFAGATRNLCDRKEVNLTDQTAVLAKFYVFSSTHVAAHFTGIITDDFTSEFDPFSPQFGEKFSPPDLPVSIKDWAGNEIARTYADHWGVYNGLTFSSWEVNPPNPTGYAPQMMVVCMNDAGSGATPDKLYNPGYSQFCYETPFMPGQTQYMDTPVTPTAAFSEGYNRTDCNYPDLTPAISLVSGDGMGPWVASAFGVTGGNHVASVTLNTGGSGYTTPPTVTFTGGGGTGATAKANIAGSVSTVTVTNRGSGFNTPPPVTIDGGDGSGATATATLSGVVDSLSLTNGGSNYSTAALTVNISGGGGTGATATATRSLGVNTVTVSGAGRGTGYTTPPAVNFIGGGNGSGTVATATLTGVIGTFTITNAGAGYTNTPAVTITGGGGTSAAATAIRGLFGANAGKITGFIITNRGTGYTSAPTVSIARPTACPVTDTATCIRATATVTASKGVNTVTVVSRGSGYTSSPFVTFTGGGGSGALGTSTTTGVVASITLTNGGSGYATAPTVSITGGGPGSGATATATVSLGIGTVTVTNGGSGYTTNPTVIFGGSGSGATATANISASVTSVTMITGGTGYTSAPTVGFTGGGGSGATGTAFLAPNGLLTITALGDVEVVNNGYSGPAATAAPFNKKTVTRHYGFGATQGTGKVTIGGVAATVTGWSDTQITVQVPATVPNCLHQQQQQFGGPATAANNAKCGELIVTSGNGQSSIDAVTVTVGGKAPTYVDPSGSIQAAIDAAKPGDLIMVKPGVYHEFLLMWKPVRLQGVGATSSVIDGNTHPAGKMDGWRRQVACLFGLALNGQPLTSNTGANPYDPSGTFTCGGWTGFTGTPNNPQVDRLPLEGILGWDTTVNGNLAQLLQEPTLMGAYEGAGITVLGRGVKFPNGATDVFGSGTESAFPVGTTLLSSNDCGSGTGTGTSANKYPSNFYCNPSSIDGLTVTNSSQGGGGIFVHAWGHNLEIANNRVINNTGTLTGGITVGQGESPDAYLQGDAGNADPGSCQNSLVAGKQLPYCFDMNVSVHNNSVTLNSSIGDELYSATPAGAGGVTFCTGADYYMFQWNWVCGNLSTGDGGGFTHLGFIYNGDIEHNMILFNQSTNPTVSTNGGGIIAMGAPPDGLTSTGLECGNTAADADCTPGLSDGTGPGLAIKSNLILGNAAESGSGGGIRLQNVNGTEVIAFPLTPANWNDVKITNNIIANNVAGWDGAGISLLDALNTDIVNNTVVSNDTTASAGVLFNTLGAKIASSQGPTCTVNCGTSSKPQPAGLVTMAHSVVLKTNINQLPTILGARIICPAGHTVTDTVLGRINGTCASFSYPALYNDVFWQNRSFYIGVGSLSAAHQNNIVSLYNAFSATPAPTQSGTTTLTANGNGSIITGGTGACSNDSSYWDIGVRGDTAPGNHSGGTTLKPISSVLTSTTGYVTSGATNLHNSAGNPTFTTQYCNGSRTPPEFQSGGWQVPPGISDATVPNPIFNLTPAATVDEGNNWVNISWGPLALTNSVTGATLGNYSPTPGSSAVDYVHTTDAGYTNAPTDDIFGHPRKTLDDPFVDAGAVEVIGMHMAIASVSPTSLTFGNQGTGTNSANQTLTLSNTGNGTLTGIVVGVTAPFNRNGGTCGATLAPATTCTIFIRFSPTTAATFNSTVTITGNVPVTGSPVAVSGTGVVPAPIASVTGGPLAFGNVNINTNSPNQTLVLHNTGNATLSGIVITATAPFNRVITGITGNCGTTLTAGSTCNIAIRFSPTALGPANSTVTITATNATVSGAPVAVSGTGVNPLAIASVSPTSLTFPNTGTGTNSANQTLTLSNTGTAQMTGIVVAVTTPFNRNGGTCGTTLNAGATCTIFVRFSPTSAVASTGTATITGSVAVANSPVSLTGTGVAPASVSLTPNPLLITLPTGSVTGSDNVTFTNTAAAGGASVTVTNVAVSGGTLTTFLFTKQAGQDTCTGVTLAPGANCKVGVTFTNFGSARGTTRVGTITFTDSGAGSPQSSALNGLATP